MRKQPQYSILYLDKPQFNDIEDLSLLSCIPRLLILVLDSDFVVDSDFVLDSYFVVDSDFVVGSDFVFDSDFVVDSDFGC